MNHLLMTFIIGAMLFVGSIMELDIGVMLTMIGSTLMFHAMINIWTCIRNEVMKRRIK